MQNFRISQPTASVSTTTSAALMSVQPALRVPSEEDFFTCFSYEVERAKWFKEDLDKGSWNEVHKSPGHVFWIKTFPKDEIPINILSSIDLPLTAEMHVHGNCRPEKPG